MIGKTLFQTKIAELDQFYIFSEIPMTMIKKPILKVEIAELSQFCIFQKF